MHLSFNNLVSSVRFSNFNSLSSQLSKPTTVVAVALAALSILVISILLVLRKRSNPLKNVKEVTHQNPVGSKSKAEAVAQENLKKKPVVVQQPEIVQKKVDADKPQENTVVDEEDDDNRPLPPIPLVSADPVFEIGEEFSDKKDKSSPPKGDNDPELAEAIRLSLEDEERRNKEEDWEAVMALKEATPPPLPPKTPVQSKLSHAKVKKDPVATVASNTSEFEEKLKVAVGKAKLIKNLSGIDPLKSEIQTNANGHRYLVLHFTRKTFCNTALPELRSDTYGVIKIGEKPIMLGNEGTVVRLTVEQSIRFQLRFNP